MTSPQTYDAVDLFAAGGGGDVAAVRLGISVLGFEIDEAARQTRDAAGHHTAVEAVEPSKRYPFGYRGISVADANPRDYLTRGEIASPPCQGFSMAGKGQARADSERLLKELDGVRTRTDLDALIASAREWMTHEGTALVLEPLRWALTNAPSWLAWEQVPAVLPVWEACATILRRRGWSVAVGNLQAEQYGVPQTRKRAILVARAPWLVAEIGPVSLPVPTHSRYHARNPTRLDDGVAPWVSMAEALGWGATARPSMTVTGGGTSTGGAKPFGNAARQGLRREEEAGRWQLATGTRPSATRRAEDQPSPALAFGNDAASHVWTPEGMTPAEVVAHKLATSTRITPEQAATLQTFPPGYPWQGTKGKIFEQIGNAIPPLLAEAVLCAVTGIPLAPAPRG